MVVGSKVAFLSSCFGPRRHLVLPRAVVSEVTSSMAVTLNPGHKLYQRSWERLFCVSGAHVRSSLNSHSFSHVADPGGICHVGREVF